MAKITTESKLRLSLTFNVLLVAGLGVFGWFFYNQNSSHESAFAPTSKKDIDKIIDTHISQRDAREYMNAWRSDSANGTLKFFWISTDIINYFRDQHTPINHINGIRFYLAKYTRTTTSAGVSHGRNVGDITLIVVPTYNNGGIDTTDMVNQYYDYSRPCPPTCVSGDIGNQ